MKSDNSKNIIIALLVVIIIILGALVVLFATDTISFNSKINNNELSNENIVDEDSINDDINNDEQVVSRDDIIEKLKTTLTDEEWIKAHLYSKENCFGEKVEVSNQKLTFTMLTDEKNNPIVIVLNDTFENYIKVIYKVYYSDGEILVKNVAGHVSHPGHTGVCVDKNQGLVIETFAHMGCYLFTAYDVKNDEIKIYDEYNCTTGNCDYEYKGEKEYNCSSISIELNSNNVNNNIK